MQKINEYKTLYKVHYDIINIHCQNIMNMED